MFHRIKSIPGLLAVFLLCSCSTQDEGPWNPLFVDDEFTGFKQLGGEALYKLENGVLTGTSVMDTENSFMATDKTYADFILEFRVKLDTGLNSGVQIRSHTYLSGRVHGYQVEIENDKPDRLYSGGIYEEARRGWLNPLEGNEPGRQAFKANDWNHYRIEAIGNSIKTFVNGTMCANLVDAFDSEGFIGFQVHNINKKPWRAGYKVHWKDIRIMTEELEKYRFQGEDPVPPTITLLQNQLTPKEKEEGWELLFDGETTEKWRGAHMDAFPDFGWVADDGTLHLEAKGGAESQGAGDIVTIDEFDHFEFAVDFMLTEGANSGIKYYVTEKEETSGSAIGLEYQLLDDAVHKDAKQGRDGNRTLSSLYDLIPADKNKRYRSPGQWNRARIVSEGDKVQHFLNDREVLEYTRGSKEYRELVAISKYKVWENFGEAEKGHILLQEHGDEVRFRNIKVRRININ